MKCTVGWDQSPVRWVVRDKGPKLLQISHRPPITHRHVMSGSGLTRPDTALASYSIAQESNLDVALFERIVVLNLGDR